MRRLSYIKSKPKKLIHPCFNCDAGRFFDIVQGRQSYLWRCEPVEGSLTSFVSAIASSGQGESMEGRRYFLSSSWIAVGFGSGLCRLVDYRSGSVVTQWRAHEAFITKVRENFHLVLRNWRHT